VSAAKASDCAVVWDLSRGAVGDQGFGGLVPPFGDSVGKRGGLASPFGEYGMDMRPIALFGFFDEPLVASMAESQTLRRTPNIPINECHAIDRSNQ
jgi:hypothetical protein